MSRSVVSQAFAKVNLTLQVRGRRPDGYHDLCSIFATVQLADTVRVAVAPRLDVRITPDVGAARGDDLASRAVRALAEASGREPRALVRIRKRIPVAAGLGGGSSDAATVVRSLANLWHVPLPTSAVAASIGSDVPFFASGAPFAHVMGRGEQVRPLPPPAVTLWIALVFPAVRLSTATVFSGLDPSERSGCDATERLSQAFADGSVDPALLRECARNDLDRAAERACGWIADARSSARGRGVTLHLSGSGPSLFAIADDRAHALRLVRALRRAGLRSRALALGAQ